MTNEIVRHDEQYALVEQVVITGDLKNLSSEQRVQYYRQVCDSLSLNWMTKPFDYITLNGKLTLYARKDATEQLRRIHGISITSLVGEIIDDLYIVTATATARDGRADQATGAVSIGGLKGEAKANAIMKAETKSKRRVTLSITGLGWTDESEIESIPGAQPANVDPRTGEIVSNARVIEPQQPDAIDTLIAKWIEPSDAMNWAVTNKHTANEFSARNRFKQIVKDSFGDRCTTTNKQAIFRAYATHYMNKAQQVQAEESEDTKEPIAF